MKNTTFDMIKNIHPDDFSWKEKIFMTFDIDWTSDDVLGHTIDLIEKYDICATFFVTHHTPLLARLKENPCIELGIHPNYNFLLNGDFRYGKTIDEVIEYYLEIVPDAVSVRTHSLVQSSPILESFSKHGLKYEVNLLLPRQTGIPLKPFVYMDKRLIRVPYFWEDDTHVHYGTPWDVSLFLNVDSLKVFDFHPIHVFLNTESIERYERSKSSQGDHRKLCDFVNRDTYATKNFLIDLIEETLRRQ